MKRQAHKGNYNKGQMTVVAVISLTGVLLSVSFSQLFLGYSEYSQSSFDNKADVALELAESGLDNAIYEYEQNNQVYTNKTVTLPNGTASVTLSANTSVTPNVVTVTSTATYNGARRSETATFSLTPPPAVTNNAAFAQNNLYAIGDTFNGEMFTNNDFNIFQSTINGDLNSAGKGNGQKNFLDNTTINPYAQTGGTGSANLWDPTYIQNNSLIKGNVNYHTVVHIDNTSTVVGSTTKGGTNLIPPIANPSFTFPQAQTLAQQNGTYFANANAFNAYLASIEVDSNGYATYTLPSGLYFVDCALSFGSCPSPYTFNTNNASNGNWQQIKGTGVSIVFNSSLLDFGSINISSPYQVNGQYYPVIATNGDSTIFSVGFPLTPYINLNGLLYTSGSFTIYGISASNPTLINGGIWASNQITLYNWVTLTYNQNYIQNVTGFTFASNLKRSTTWYENP